jgi:hypothetical protein
MHACFAGAAGSGSVFVSSRGSEVAVVAGARPPSASSSADDAAVEGVAAVTAGRRVFTRVVEGARAPQVFPAGERAPIDEGVGFRGYARAGAKPVHDPAFVRGAAQRGMSANAALLLGRRVSQNLATTRLE